MTRQFDVHLTPFRRDKEIRPFIVVVQSDRIDNASRVCAPLVAARFLVPDGRLNPAFTVNGQKCFLHPAELATFPLRQLRDPVANLEDARERIVAALDLVFTGI